MFSIFTFESLKPKPQKIDKTIKSLNLCIFNQSTFWVFDLLHNQRKELIIE